MLTAQEIFDKVATHLYEQNEPAMASAGCMYRVQRDDRTLSCAVGCLIPDDQYRPEFDSESDLQDLRRRVPHLFAHDTPVVELLGTSVAGLVGYLPFEEALLAGGVFVHEHLDLLERLQGIHDTMYEGYGAETRKQLTELAEQHALSAEVLKELE